MPEPLIDLINITLHNIIHLLSYYRCVVVVVVVVVVGIEVPPIAVHRNRNLRYTAMLSGTASTIYHTIRPSAQKTGQLLC